MSSITFPQAVRERTSSPHPVHDFVTAWYEATPASILLRSAAPFLRAWFQATPVAIVLRTVFR
jgi:hypothetical protein